MSQSALSELKEFEVSQAAARVQSPFLPLGGSYAATGRGAHTLEVFG